MKVCLVRSRSDALPDFVRVYGRYFFPFLPLIFSTFHISDNELYAIRRLRSIPVLVSSDENTFAESGT